MSRPDLGLPERPSHRSRGGCWRSVFALLLSHHRTQRNYRRGVLVYMQQQLDSARAESTPPQVL